MNRIQKLNRHTRILDIRLKLQKGWNYPQLKQFCKTNLRVSNTTAISYIDEAAKPFREKYQKELEDILNTRRNSNG